MHAKHFVQNGNILFLHIRSHNVMPISGNVDTNTIKRGIQIPSGMYVYFQEVF